MNDNTSQKNTVPCDDHDWHWMAEAYEPNDDGETTAKIDWYECIDCTETKAETTQLQFVKRHARGGSNPLANWGGR